MQNNSTLLHQTSPEGLVDLLMIAIRQELKDLKAEAPASVDEELLTKKQACDLLKIKETTLWRWQKQGRIDCYKISKNNYYKRSELLNCLILLKK
jgi:hypothetical protein